MRFRLRTLLIVLTVGPMVLTGGWWSYPKYRDWRVREAQLSWDSLDHLNVFRTGR